MEALMYLLNAEILTFLIIPLALLGEAVLAYMRYKLGRRR
jgi:hypothetical protein